MPLPYRILHRFTIPLRYITPQNYALAPRYDSILCHCLTIPDLTELHHAIAIRHIAIAERNTTRQCRRKTQHYRTKLCLCKTLLDNAIAALYCSLPRIAIALPHCAILCRCCTLRCFTLPLLYDTAHNYAIATQHFTLP